MAKLYRSQRDKKLLGLCGGIAEMIHVDSTLLRLVVIVTAFFSGGAVILLYFLAGMVIPKEPLTHIPGGFGFGQPHYGGGTGSGCGFGGAPNGGFAGAEGQHPTGFAGRRNGAPFTTAQGVHVSYGKPVQPSVDEMMKDIEKKALLKEIEQLRAKVANYEKGDV